MEDIRPTAKWANRMLRPLTSIYHRLAKHHEIVTSVLISKAKERLEAALDAKQTRPVAQGEVGGCSYSDDEEPNDPAWVPGKPEKRRIRHSYSSRGQRNGARRRSRLSIRSPEAPKTLPGAIEIATPLITGKVRASPVQCEASSSSAESFRVQLFRRREESGKTGRSVKSSFPSYQGSWKEVLDQSGDPGFVEIALLLDRVFLKFLRKTARSSPSAAEGHDGRGARSLLSMAVRRLPQFIAEEQRLQDELEEGEVDMCDAYFTELEASYAPSGNGWQPLREAVRAQGLYLVSRMIQNHWITHAAACRLLEECLSQEELDAFESLLTKYLACVHAYQYPTAFDPPRPSGHRDDPVHILGTYFLRYPTRRSYAFDELTKLLTRGALPPEWMVTTKWKKCVDGAIKSLSTEDRDYVAARRLIEAVILSSAGIYPTSSSKVLFPRDHSLSPRPLRFRDTRASLTNSLAPPRDQYSCPIPIQDALSNLVASLLTALCGMGIARSQAGDAGKRRAGLKMREIVKELAFNVQQAIGFGPVTGEAEELTFHALRRGYVLLADCTLQCGNRVTAEIILQSETVSRHNIVSFFQTLASRQDVVRELARLVSQVFHHSGHTNSLGPLRTPKEIRARVSQLAHLTSAAGVALLLGKVAAEAAMELAEKSLDPDDHAWAVDIQEKAVSSQQEGSSGHSSSPSQTYANERIGLYRWEDSIGEWVASTPAAKPKALNRDIVAAQRVTRPGRPRVIPCSTSSSSASSTCSENTISSATSSAPSIPKKRPCASEAPSPRPFKKIYHTRSAERVADKPSDWPKIPDRPPCEPSEATHVPVAARTRTALRALLQRGNIAGQGTTRAVESPAGSVPKIEVVIVNKAIPSECAVALKDYIESESESEPEPQPVRRRTRRSSFLPKRDPVRDIKLSLRRKSAPAPIIKRSHTVIPCSEDDDSDDELSFL